MVKGLCAGGRRLVVEDGFSKEALADLKKKGHHIVSVISGHGRAVFGRGQIIQRNPKTGVLWGGSEPRADGQCLGW